MSIEYAQTPNYEKIKFLMRKVLIENNLKPSDDFIFGQD